MKIIALVLFFCSQVSHSSTMTDGGDRVGNGGDVLLCQEPGAERLHVLDELESGHSLTIGDKNLPYTMKIDLLLNRLKKYFPARYDFYLKNFNNFKANATFTNSDLPEINDEGGDNETSCLKLQAAYFRKDVKKDFVYFIHKQIWDRLNNDQKTVLVFHELIYSEAIGLDFTNSYFVRMANGLIFESEDYDPTAFDNTFYKPLRHFEGREDITLTQLQNAFSERIAIFLLEKDLSRFYSDKKAKSTLLILKERFSENAIINTLLDEHLRRISFTDQ